MSERRSWDVTPKRQAPKPAAPVRRAPASVDAMRPVRKVTSTPVRAPRAPQRPQQGRLRDRRRQARKTGLIVLSVFFGVLLAVTLYVLWLPALRIQNVEASGPEAEAVAATARAALTGTYALIIPRNSIFFFSKEGVRSAVLNAHPQISAVSISRSSFSGISILGTSRASSFIWCGVSIEERFPNDQCFEADIEGLIFREASVSTTTAVLSTGSSTPTSSGDLRIFGPLSLDLTEGGSPVGNRVAGAEAIPTALRFVKAIRGLGVPVSSLSLREDEADLWIPGPTRITYVLGREEEAAQLAASVIPTLNLTDGTIEYLDLRFKGKAYVKRYGE